ncbi:MAG: precorrin-6A reductase [Oscillospiraceae bacterium]|nr:precorrin-6A reductase [Oscillospiraceae bacterium]
MATEYGETLIEPAENVVVSARRLNEEEMEALLRRERFDLVIDATHPYASAVTENLLLACSRTGTEYVRLEREGACLPGDAVRVPDIAAAVEYLNTAAGNILLTTGSKDLPAFSAVTDFAKRVYARVLPMESSLAQCRAAGLEPSHILAMQGPFSLEMNAAMIASINAAYVVTKDSGRAGGFAEKAAAAEKTGARLVVIGRPESAAAGLSFPETTALLEKRFGFVSRSCVSVIGAGAGRKESLTVDAAQALSEADCVIGAGRLLALARPDQTRFAAVSAPAIADAIRAHREFSRFAVLMSGDTGFYSGAKKLLPLLDFCDVRVFPGVSSLAYLCAALGTSYEDVLTLSLHGRDANLLPAVHRNARVFALVGGDNGAGKLIDTLCENGLASVRVSVGEKLGCPDEKVTCGTSAQLSGRSFDALSCVLIENGRPESPAPGLPDEAFTRSGEGAPVIPMTKSEVRAVVMSKLRLLPDSVAWDIGSGTGSVAVEMALASPRGRVYAVEKKPEACDLIRANASAFGLTNLETVEGAAPEACRNLPAPTHAFVGGSSGNMRQILSLLLEKNPSVRIVASAIALETVAGLSDAMGALGFTETEVVCVNVAKAKRLGPYSLMTGQNPVYLFTMQRV